MRKYIVLALAPLLAACGDGEDFKTQFARSQDDVFAALANIDARPQYEFISAGSTITHSRPADDTIQFTLLSPDGSEEAIYAFRVEAVDANNSIVHTTVDVPAIKLKLEGKDMYVSEWKLEMGARKAMQGLAKTMKSGSSGYSEVAGLGELIGITAILLDPAKVQEASTWATDMSAASEELARQAQWHEDGQSDWASADGAMDDAYGERIQATEISGSDAAGSGAYGSDPEGFDPTPDDDFGSGSDDW